MERLKPYRTRLLLLLAVIGPGIITANVDNDAGGISTYSVAGAKFGYSLMWMMPLVAVALIIVQEMSARLGVVTGKGLADLLRENMGVRLTAIVLSLLVFVNLANTVSEFAGVAASMEIFGVNKYISIPIAALVVWLLIIRANYKTVERVFLIASAIYLSYIASGVLAHPNWREVSHSLVTPNFQLNTVYITIFVTIIGTTIATWMQFYQQASIVDKGLKVSDYRYERIDVVVGSIFAVLVASLYNDCLCGYAISEQDNDIYRQRCSRRLGSIGWQIRFGTICDGFAQRLHVFGCNFASVHSLHGLRSIWMGVRCEPRAEGSPGLFHHLHILHRPWLSDYPASYPISGGCDDFQPDTQRLAAAGDFGRHVDFDQ